MFDIYVRVLPNNVWCNNEWPSGVKNIKSVQLRILKMTTLFKNNVVNPASFSSSLNCEWYDDDDGDDNDCYL